MDHLTTNGSVPPTPTHAEEHYFDPDKLEEFILNVAGGPATPRPSHPVAKTLFWVFTLAFSAMLLTAMLAGCHSTTTGGSAQTETIDATSNGGKHEATTQQSTLTIPTPYGNITYTLGSGQSSSESPSTTTHKETAASTQPSFDTSNENFMANLGSADAGETASLLVKQIKSSALRPMVWPVALGFLGLAALAYFMQKKLVAILCVALAALTFLFPLWVGLLMVLVIGMIAYTYRKQIMEIVEGNRNALAVVPPTEAVTLKKEMERAHSHSTKKVLAQGKVDAT